MRRRRNIRRVNRPGKGRRGRFFLGFLFGVAAGVTLYLMTDNWILGFVVGIVLAVLFGFLNARKMI